MTAVLPLRALATRAAKPAPAAATLDGVRAGTAVRVHRVTSEQRRRLAELGIRPGASVRVLTRSAGGGLTLSIGTSRLALDRGVARDIEVAGP